MHFDDCNNFFSLVFMIDQNTIKKKDGQKFKFLLIVVMIKISRQIKMDFHEAMQIKERIATLCHKKPV
jgi:hypothetical protein